MSTEQAIAPASGAVRSWLERAPVAAFSVYAIAAAFITYFCMYSFRKPWAVGTYAGQSIGPLDLKNALLISQVLGYALSKWLGVKFVSELRAERRAVALLVLLAFAELALLAFAVLPPAGKVVAMFLNGLPLGAIWGLVFGFLEGRRTSEMLGAGLSCSYIVASGAVKSVGAQMMALGVPEPWMPFTTGLLFVPVLLVSVWGLKQLPPPTAEDIAARTARAPMLGAQRRAFVRRFLGGLFALTVLYFFLTAYRDFRDNYAVELWTELGFEGKPEIFTFTELPIALCVMVTLAMLYRVRDNRLGLLATHGIMLAGVLLVGASTLLFDAGVVSGVPWMILVGLGLYLAYVPYGCVLFDRMIAATGVVATAVFMIYVTDAAGYIGSVSIVLYKQFGSPDSSMLDFFRQFSYFTALFCAVCFAVSAVYFARRSREPREAD